MRNTPAPRDISRSPQHARIPAFRKSRARREGEEGGAQKEIYPPTTSRSRVLSWIGTNVMRAVIWKLEFALAAGNSSQEILASNPFIFLPHRILVLRDLNNF